ncbi:hypothetical protein [Streptomyces sp. NPDC002346]
MDFQYFFVRHRPPRPSAMDVAAKTATLATAQAPADATMQAAVAPYPA